MNIRSLLGLGRDVKRIALFGLGVSNLEILKEMTDNVEIVLRSDAVIDKRKFGHDGRIVAIYDGARVCEDICEDVIIFSPSVRRDRAELLQARERGVLMTSDCELFSSSNNAPIFAVTGSDGKSTSATLISKLLAEHFSSVALCGNIGVPMLSAPRSDAYAVELSSFQLTYSRVHATRAGITNITPNHLNWHKSFEEYRDVKLSLADSADEYALCCDDGVCLEYLKRQGAHAVFSAERSHDELKSKYGFSLSYTLEGEHICRCGEPYIALSDILRSEKYNLKNLMLALCVCDGYVTEKHARRVAREFSGLPHRLELVGELDGVRYFDSSIDTSPSRTVSTLSSVDAHCVVILGGRKKGIPLEPLLPIMKKRARAAVVMGECKEELLTLLSNDVACIPAENMRDAVRAAANAAMRGDCIILSPAATSYDSYNSFSERGDDFKKQVNEHINASKCK